MDLRTRSSATVRLKNCTAVRLLKFVNPFRLWLYIFRKSALWKIAASKKLPKPAVSFHQLCAAHRAGFDLCIRRKLCHLFVTLLIHNTIIKRPVRPLRIDLKVRRKVGQLMVGKLRQAPPCHIQGINIVVWHIPATQLLRRLLNKFQVKRLDIVPDEHFTADKI